jgi:peptidoglycan/xylan/chitin deacetylase (PgdA/CDA1 family)
MAGHLVANHSFSHSHYGFLRPAGYWRSELALTDNAIEDVIGRRPAMFRPPMGVKSPAIASEAARAGHAVVTWTQRGRDGVRTSVAGLEARLLARVGPGDVLLLHDGIEPNGRRDPSVTLRALPRIIRELRARDLEPVRLDELLDIPAYQTAPVTSRRIRACA